MWLVNPDQKTLEIYLREDQKWMLLNAFEGNQLVHAAPFDAIELNIANLWLPDNDDN